MSPLSMSLGTGAAHGAIVPIGSVKLSSPATNITFANIPQGYQDLMVIVYGRINLSLNTNAAINLYANTVSQSPTSWSDTRLSSNGSSVTSARGIQSGPTYGAYVWAPTMMSSPNLFSTTTFHLLNYASTANTKTVIAKNACDLNQSGTTDLVASTFQSTSAVTTIQIGSGYGVDYAEGSTFNVYGIRSVGQ